MKYSKFINCKSNFELNLKFLSYIIIFLSKYKFYFLYFTINTCLSYIFLIWYSKYSKILKNIYCILSLNHFDLLLKLKFYHFIFLYNRTHFIITNKQWQYRVFYAFLFFVKCSIVDDYNFLLSLKYLNSTIFEWPYKIYNNLIIT